MQIVRHPKLAEDIRDAATHYGEISGRVLAAFWSELDSALASIERNPRSHHFDFCGLRRANLQKFPYHLLYEVEGEVIYFGGVAARPEASGAAALASFAGSQNGLGMERRG